MAKVLIVDDHPAIRMAVNMLLKQEEHHVLGKVRISHMAREHLLVTH